MAIVFEQLILLFMFMIIGFIFGKSKLIDRAHTKILSTLEVYLFLPATIFNAFSTNFTVDNMKNYYKFPLLGIFLLCIIVLLAFTISRFMTKDDFMRKVYTYTLVIPNFGYMGYALAEAIGGTALLLNMILFAFPFSCFTYSAGYCMLTNKKFNLKTFFNPVLITVIVGAIFGICGFTLPTVAKTFVSKASSCMAPVSMLLAGLTISEFKISGLVTDVKVYILSVLRLVVIPLLVFFCLKPFLAPDYVKVAVLLTAMPCGLNTIIFPKLIDEDCTTGAKLAFVSNILAIATLPIILNLI